MSSELDYWRQFLQTANYDIFKTIEHAIHVAATDYPDQFEKKEHLMHIISTALSNKVLQNIASEHKNHTQLNDKKDKGKKVEIVNAESWTSEDDDEDDENVGIRDWLNKKSEKKQRKRKGKHVVTNNIITKKTSWNRREVHTETGSGSSMNNVISTAFTVKNGCAANLVAKEVEVKSDVLTKENDVLGDVSKIRDALLQLKGQPVIAYELLMRLEKMNISAHVLQVTEIAAIVSFFADNDCSDSTHTRMLASSLLESWSIILDKWIEHANNARVVAETDKITVATDIVEPKSSIEAAKRTGPIQFIKGSSRPQSSQPIFDIGSRGSAINARCVLAGQQAERYKNRQLASSSQVQIGGSARVNNYTTLKGQPKAELQGPKLIATEVLVLAKKIEEDPVRESLNIARKKLQEMLQNHKPDAKCTVACQPDETHHIKHKQLTSGSQVQIGGPSKAYNYSTSIKSQPRSGLQGPKLTVKDALDAKNKMEVPAPIEKIEEDPVQESMTLAKRKFQEMQKSEQAKRHNMGLQSVNLAKRYNFVQRTPLSDPPQTYVRTLNDAYGSFVQLPKEGIILADELTPPEKTVSLVRTTTAATTRARRPLISDDTLDQLGTDFRTLHDHIMSEQELRSNYNIYINPGLLAHDGAQIFLRFSDIKDLMTWQWLTESIIQVWILYLITLSERDGISVGFMDPSKINQVALDKNNDDAVSYMANAMITFMDRKFILAPYYQSKHWVVLVIQPRDCMVYVLDTKIPEEGTKYVITRPFQTAFQSYVKLGGEYNGRKGEKVSWKFAKCPQQTKNWECGYYIMKLMHDLITTWHSLWPNCALSRRAIPMTDLHQIRLQWVKFLLGKIDK